MKDFQDFKWNDITIKYDHWFAPMIPFIKDKNKIYGKVIGKTIYLSHPKEIMLKRDKNGQYVYKRLLRHEFQHVYQMYEESTIIYLIKYGFKFCINMFKHYFNPRQAYLNISYEKDARDSEHQPLSHCELKVIERSK